MSETPRTDALIREIHEGRTYETVGPMEHLARTLERELAEARYNLWFFMDATPEPPDTNCSCHIHPPCDDCVEFDQLREAFAQARAFLQNTGREGVRNEKGARP